MTRKLTPAAATIGSGDGDQWRTLKQLLPYLWPHGRTDLKLRIAAAMLALVLSKIVTVATPYAFKYATDALTAAGGTAAVAVSVPLFLVLAYGVGRVMMVALAQIRDAHLRQGRPACRARSGDPHLPPSACTVAQVPSRAPHRRPVAHRLARHRSASTRCCDFRCSTPFPPSSKSRLVAGLLAWSFGWPYAAVILGTVVLYVWFTYAATEWRIAIRRAMNDADTDANTKAIDSLLNFETVKYFGNEEHEAERFDRSMAKYEKAAVKTWVSLAVLNAGQAFIYAVGLDHYHGHVGDGDLQGPGDGRRFRPDQRPDDPALHAAQLHRLRPTARSSRA